MSAAFSADGKLLATASYDIAAHLFEVASGKEIAQFAHGAGYSMSRSARTANCWQPPAQTKWRGCSMSRTGRKSQALRTMAASKVSPSVRMASCSQRLRGSKNGTDGVVRLFDMANYKEITRLPHRSHGLQRRLQPGWSSARFFVIVQGDGLRGSGWQGNQRNQSHD